MTDIKKLYKEDLKHRKKRDPRITLILDVTEEDVNWLKVKKEKEDESSSPRKE